MTETSSSPTPAPHGWHQEIERLRDEILKYHDAERVHTADISSPSELFHLYDETEDGLTRKLTEFVRQNGFDGPDLTRFVQTCFDEENYEIELSYETPDGIHKFRRGMDRKDLFEAYAGMLTSLKSWKKSDYDRCRAHDTTCEMVDKNQDRSASP